MTPVRLCVVTLGILAACRDADRPSRAAAPPPRPPAPAVAPKPVDLTLGDGLEMRRPVRSGRIAVIPIVATSQLPAAQYLTLNAGLAQHKITVREIHGGEGDITVEAVRV